jgi:transcriptional regulator with XRE-family HTH domain
MATGDTKIGDAIRSLRIQKHLTQVEFADKCEMSQAYISKIEQGESNISISCLSKISNVLGIKPSEIICKSLTDETNSLIEETNSRIRETMVEAHSLIEKFKEVTRLIEDLKQKLPDQEGNGDI